MSPHEDGTELVDRPFPDGFCVQVDALMAEDSVGGRPPGTLKVRKVLWRNGKIVCKWGLSWTTGEWLPVAEAEPYPEECFLVPHGPPKGVTRAE